jgi:hypothetical protein
MIFLPQSLATFNRMEFAATIKQELALQDDFAQLLQQTMQFGSCALLDELEIMLNKVEADERQIHIEVGAFYHSIIAGCNCADDPSPVEKNNEYAEIGITIERASAQAILKAR